MEKVAPRHRGMAWRLNLLRYALHNQVGYVFRTLESFGADGSLVLDDLALST